MVFVVVVVVVVVCRAFTGSLTVDVACRHVDALAKDLIRRLLTADKTKRIGCLRGGAEDIKSHKWFDRLNWDHVLRCTLPVPFVPKVSLDSGVAPAWLWRGCTCLPVASVTAVSLVVCLACLW